MTEPPRRLPLTDQERLKVATSRMAAGSAAGQSRYAAPAARSGDTNPTPLDTGGAGAAVPVGALQQVDTTSRTSTGFYLDPSSGGFTFGDASSMSYVSSSDPGNPDPGEPGIVVTETGWYYASAEIDIAGTPTQLIRLQINSPEGYGLGNAYLTPGLTGSQTMTVSALIYLDGGFPTALIAVHVDNPGGATIASGNVTVVKLS